jgi:hypothetical protein
MQVQDGRDVKPNPQYTFTLLATMCWSKNILDEQDAPDQILLGAMDWWYCVLLELALWLEIDEETSPFLFGIDGIDDPVALKKKPLILYMTMCLETKHSCQQYRLASLELTVSGNMREQEQGGMVPNKMMLTVGVDGERESNNLIHSLTHAYHGLMQK